MPFYIIEASFKIVVNKSEAAVVKMPRKSIYA